MENILQKSKNWFLGAGIILLILGAAAIAVPLAASIAIETIFGWIFVLSGIVTIAQSFRAVSSGKCILRLLAGIFYFAVGIMFLVHPMEGVLTLTLLLAILFMFEGIIKIAVSVQLKPATNWIWMLVSGIAALILSVLIFAGYPSTAAWVLGLLVGINLMFSGWTMLMFSSVAEAQKE